MRNYTIVMFVFFSLVANAQDKVVKRQKTENSTGKIFTR